MYTVQRCTLYTSIYKNKKKIRFSRRDEDESIGHNKNIKEKNDRKASIKLERQYHEQTNEKCNGHQRIERMSARLRHNT